MPGQRHPGMVSGSGLSAGELDILLAETASGPAVGHRGKEVLRGSQDDRWGYVGGFIPQKPPGLWDYFERLQRLCHLGCGGRTGFWNRYKK